MSPLTTADRSIAPKAITASTSTSAKAGKTAVIEVLAALARPTNVVTPGRRRQRHQPAQYHRIDPDHHDRHRDRDQHRCAVVNQSVPPPAGPCRRSTIRPPTAPATAAMSITIRLTRTLRGTARSARSSILISPAIRCSVSQGHGHERDRGGDAAEPPRERFVLMGGQRHGQGRTENRARYHHDRPGPDREQHQLPPRRSPGPEQAELGRPPFGQQPGTEQQHDQAHDDELTYSSESRLPIWPSVCTNSVSAPVTEDCRDSVSGVSTEEVTTPALSSPFSSVALSGATSFACTLLRSSGNSQVTVMLESVIAVSRSLSSESPMIIPPSQ